MKIKRMDWIELYIFYIHAAKFVAYNEAEPHKVFESETSFSLNVLF